MPFLFFDVGKYFIQQTFKNKLEYELTEMAFWTKAQIGKNMASYKRGNARQSKASQGKDSLISILLYHHLTGH